MTLYEIDNAILDCVDEETGEIVNDILFSELLDKKKDKIEAVALWIKNLKAEELAYKAEKEAFAERQKEAKLRIDSLCNILKQVLGGEKFETTLCKIGFRKSESVEIISNSQFVDWAKANDCDLLTFKEPEPNKTNIKKSLQQGIKIPFVEIKKNLNINIK